MTDAKFDEDWSCVSAGLDNPSLRDGMTGKWKPLPDALGVMNQESSNPIHTKLFDLGCTAHILPYRDSGNFSSFTPIPPPSSSVLPTSNPSMPL